MTPSGCSRRRRRNEPSAPQHQRSIPGALSATQRPEQAPVVYPVAEKGFSGSGDCRKMWPLRRAGSATAQDDSLRYEMIRQPADAAGLATRAASPCRRYLMVAPVDCRCRVP
jgi:hypothetical protein